MAVGDLKQAIKALVTETETDLVDDLPKLLTDLQDKAEEYSTLFEETSQDVREDISGYFSDAREALETLEEKLKEVIREASDYADDHL